MGATTTGKTFDAKAFAKSKNLKFFTKTPHQQGKHWWDGYDTQEVVIIDEFEPSEYMLGFKFMLQLMDENPFQVPVKGGYRNFAPQYVFITSNHHPSTWYEYKSKNDFVAFTRRVDKIVQYRGMYGDSANPVIKTEHKVCYDEYAEINAIYRATPDKIHEIDFRNTKEVTPQVTVRADNTNTPEEQLIVF